MLHYLALKYQQSIKLTFFKSNLAFHFSKILPALFQYKYRLPQSRHYSIFTSYSKKSNANMANIFKRDVLYCN